MASRTPFPLDIVDMVLSELHAAGNFKTLQNCSLVSRSLLKPSRKRLFSAIALCDERRDALRHLHAITLKNPDLVSHFRTLEIVGLRWSTVDNLLLDLLQRIADTGVLNTLSVRTAGICWTRLQPDFQQALLRVLRSPLLHTVRLINICPSFPIECLKAVPRLQHLAFSYEDERRECKHKEAGPSPAALPGPKSVPPAVERPLESLQFGRSAPKRLLEYLTKRCESGISPLRELCVDSLEPDTVTAASQVLQQAKDTIESLIWINASYELSSQDQIHDKIISKLDYRALPRLRFITFYITDPGTHRFKFMADLLRKHGLPHTVEELTILIEFQPDIEDSGDVVFEVGGELASVDADALFTACAGVKGSMLKKVEVKLLTTGPEDVDDEHFQGALPDWWLPELHKTGLLVGSAGLLGDKWKILNSLSVASRA